MILGIARSVDAKRYLRALSEAEVRGVSLPLHRQAYDGPCDPLPSFVSSLVRRKRRPSLIQRSMHQIERFGIEYSVRDHDAPSCSSSLNSRYLARPSRGGWSSICKIKLGA